MYAHVMPVRGRPTGLRDGGPCPLLRNLAEFMVARLAKLNAPAFATLLRHGAGTGQTLDTIGIREAFTIVTELGQQGGREKVTGAGQRSNNS